MYGYTPGFIVVCAIKTLSKAVISTPIAIYKWFNKPWTQHTKKDLKKIMVVGNFLTSFVKARNLVITNLTAKLEGTVVDTHS